MSKTDKILATVLGLVAGVNGFLGLGIYLANEESKITDRDVAGNLLISAAAIIGLKAQLYD